jgi:hypothetical protein
MSVKERLLQKIQLLEKIKNGGQSENILREKDEIEKTQITPLIRRQSRLRKSVDHSNCSVDLEKCLPAILTSQESCNQIDPTISGLTVADIDRELAMYKSRERIEDDLNLPQNRLARLSVLKANVDKINAKFLSFKKVNKSDKSGRVDDALTEEKKYYVPSRFTKNGMVSG